MAGGGVGEAMAIGALMGAGTGGVMAAAQDKDPLQGALLGAVTGAATGGIGAGAGGAATSVAENLGTQAVEQGLEQGVEQGIQQGIQQGVQQGVQQGTTQAATQGVTQTAAGSGAPAFGSGAGFSGTPAANFGGGANFGASGVPVSGDSFVGSQLANQPGGAVDWMGAGKGAGFAENLTNAQAYGAGAAGGIGGLYSASQMPGQQDWPTESEDTSSLSYFKYDPTKYRAEQPTPRVYEANYRGMADGGIASLNPMSPMSNTVYPQSQQTQTAFSTSPQYPNSMRSAMASDYDTRTNPALGTEMPMGYARGGIARYGVGGGIASLGGYSDGGRLLRGPGDGVSDSIPASIGGRQPARLADGEFVVPSRIVSELGNGSTDAGARRLYDMMDRVQRRRGTTVGKGKVAKNTKAYQELPA